MLTHTVCYEGGGGIAPVVIVTILIPYPWEPSDADGDDLMGMTCEYLMIPR